MTKIDKLINRLLNVPSDFRYSELRTVLKHLGFQEYNKGKTSGSRVYFIHTTSNENISLHKPHPSNVVNRATIKDVIEQLRLGGYL